MIAVERVSKSYRGRPVLRDVSLAIARGETVALVGASGSGKSTLARLIAGWEAPDSGSVRRDAGVRTQIILQQPAASLNPRFTAAEAIEEPLVIQHRLRQGAAAHAAELVGLRAEWMQRRTHEFSGGERQRLAIARALVTEPDLLILDESFAGLDPDLTAQITDLLRALRDRTGVAYLLIAHDLDLAAKLAGCIAVMSGGELVEQGTAAQVLETPASGAARELVEAWRVLS